MQVKTLMKAIGYSLLIGLEKFQSLVSTPFKYVEWVRIYNLLNLKTQFLSFLSLRKVSLEVSLNIDAWKRISAWTWRVSRSPV